MSSVTLASGLALSYARQGDAADPAVLLLPGPTDSWRSYQPVLDHLPRDTPAVAVSQRGHGDSDKPDTGYGVEDFAADVVLLLDALGIARAVLAGHSGSFLVARKDTSVQEYGLAPHFMMRDHTETTPRRRVLRAFSQAQASGGCWQHEK